MKSIPQHSRDEDFACFAIWERGRAKETEIIKDLMSHFEVLGTFHIHWSDKNYNRNIARLYESNSGVEPFYKYSKKIGKTPFTFIVVRDKTPQYTYMKSASGAIEPSNKNVVDRKYAHRALFEEAFQVHSSHNPYEFSFQAALILGIQTLEATLRGENAGNVIELHKDLEGADGWRDWDELFSILNYSSNYTILRNFENLQVHQDIDTLCDDYQRFASAANIYQETTTPYKGTMRIAGRQVALNIRFIGDGYYPSAWAKDILARRTRYKNLYIPTPPDLFFSLLYHAKVHAQDLEQKYTDTLAAMAKELGYIWFTPEKLPDDAWMGSNLAGYMRAEKYFYEKPLDKDAAGNATVIKALPTLKDISPRLGKQLKNAIRKIFKKRRR